MGNVQKGIGSDKRKKDTGNRTLCPYRNFNQAIISWYYSRTFVNQLLDFSSDLSFRMDVSDKSLSSLNLLLEWIALYSTQDKFYLFLEQEYQMWPKLVVSNTKT